MELSLGLGCIASCKNIQLSEFIVVAIASSFTKHCQVMREGDQLLSQKEDANFGHSQFKGKDDLTSHLHRW
jgi:hypothetical protein